MLTRLSVSELPGAGWLSSARSPAFGLLGRGARVGVHGLQRTDTSLSELRDVLQVCGQDRSGPFGERVRVRHPELEGVPIERDTEALLEVDADVRLAPFDLPDVFRAQVGQLRQFGLANPTVVALPLQRGAEAFTKARVRGRQRVATTPSHSVLILCHQRARCQGLLSARGRLLHNLKDDAGVTFPEAVAGCRGEAVKNSIP
jgi:hypothetical protein